MKKPTPKSKTSIRSRLIAVAALVLWLAVPVYAAPADADGSTSRLVIRVATTVQSWIDSLTDLVLPASDAQVDLDTETSVDEAGVDIGPNG